MISKFSVPIFCSYFFLLLFLFALLLVFLILLKSSMFGLACSKFGLKIWASCSKCSKFGVSMFEVFEVRYFDVRSKTKIYTIREDFFNYDLVIGN